MHSLVWMQSWQGHVRGLQNVRDQGHQAPSLLAGVQVMQGRFAPSEKRHVDTLNIPTRDAVPENEQRLPDGYAVPQQKNDDRRRHRGLPIGTMDPDT